MTKGVAPELLEPLRMMTPLGRFGEASDIANAAVYLASDESSFVTGQCISPNGGLVIEVGVGRGQQTRGVFGGILRRRRQLRTRGRPATCRGRRGNLAVAGAPLGHVIGEREGFTRRRSTAHGSRTSDGAPAPSSPTTGSWGPDGMNEAVGGLFRPIADYEPYTGDRVIRTGYWGLAPLVDSPVVRGPAASVARAAIDDGCEGVIMFAAGRANNGPPRPTARRGRGEGRGTGRRR